MHYLNIEIKARCKNPAAIREYLESKKAFFNGVDEQVDTYFHTNKGRLKLREGMIENNLIYYERNNQAGPKSSAFNLARLEDSASVKDILTKSMGVKVVIRKKREIWYIDNVKFHIDDVPGLGSFVEIEAGNMITDLSVEELRQQCDHYMQELGIRDSDLLQYSYSDMLMEKVNG